MDTSEFATIFLIKTMYGVPQIGTSLNDFIHIYKARFTYRLVGLQLWGPKTRGAPII